MAERHQFRADWHDYNDGIYFVTACSKDKKCVFGKIADSRMTLIALGMIVDRGLQLIEAHWPEAKVHEYVVMPNHVHILLEIEKYHQSVHGGYGS